MKKKKRPEIIRPIYNQWKKGRSYYFLSKWIANLGVVPLLRFCALRFCPRLISLWALLFSVTRVRETMVKLLHIQKVRNFKKNTITIGTLPGQPPHVKAFIPLHPCFLTLFLLFSPSIYLQAEENKTILLSVGELKEIDLGENIKTYSLGNPDILSYKAPSKKGKFLARGKKMGYCEILVWPKTGAKRTFSVYVLSKQKYLGLLQITEQLRAPSLQVSLLGTRALVKGQIEDKNTWRNLAQIEKNHPDVLIIEATPSNTLKTEILGEVTKYLLDEFIDSARCWWNDGQLECEYALSAAPGKDLLEYLSKNYGVKFFPRNMHPTAKNYRISIKLMQMENLRGKEIDFGLSQLSGKLEDFFNGSITSIIQQNNFILKSQNIDLSTLATPEIVAQIGKPVLIEIGAEIPYPSTGPDKTTNTDWKFAGLKTEIELKEQGSELAIEYKNQFTRPETDGAVTGNKQSSRLAVIPNVAVELFQIELKTWGQGSVGIPLISQIPLLGEIFQSKSDQNTYKKIVAVALIKEERP